MNVYEAIAMRRDVRNEFSGEVIDEERLQRLLQAGGPGRHLRPAPKRRARDDPRAPNRCVTG